MEHSFTVRPFERARDLLRLISLIEAGWVSGRGPLASLHVGDLCWRLRNPEYEERLFLWERGEELVGFAEWEPADAFLDVQMHPRYANGSLAESMLEWAEREADGRAVQTFALDTDSAYRSALAKRGYEGRPGKMHHRYRSLADGFDEEPALPAGYKVRSLRGLEEMAARVQGHRAGWESTKLTEERYRRIMDTPAYRLDFDVAVVTSAGEFVATTNLWMDANRSVIFEPVSTSPEHRRLGLGQALMRFGLRQAYRAGARDIWVAAHVDNVASNALYESVGFRVVCREVDYAQS